MTEMEFDQTHLEAILTTNAIVKSMVEEQRRAREDRLKAIELLNSRLDRQQDCMEEMGRQTTDLEVRTAALELCAKPVPLIADRVTQLEWAWMKIAGFCVGLSIVTGVITAWIIVYLPGWLTGMKGGGL